MRRWIRRALIWLEMKRQARRYARASEQLVCIVRLLEIDPQLRGHVRRALFDGAVQPPGRGRR